MSKLINDRIPDLLALSGQIPRIRTVVDNTEFFSLLKEKLLEDVKRIFSNEEAENKAKALADVLIDLEPLQERLSPKLMLSFEEFLENRKERLGLFKEKLVLESEATETMSLEEKKKFVINFAEKNNYPSVVLKRDSDDKPYKLIGKGKKYWDSALSWADLEYPSKENFEDVFLAAQKGEIYEADN